MGKLFSIIEIMTVFITKLSIIFEKIGFFSQDKEFRILLLSQIGTYHHFTFSDEAFTACKDTLGLTTLSNIVYF